MSFASSTAPQNAAISATPASRSLSRGEKTSQKFFPFTSAEKLETQNGVTNSRNIGQDSRSTGVLPDRVVLMSSATPMIPLSPSDVSQIRQFGSKYRTRTTRYQMK